MRCTPRLSMVYGGSQLVRAAGGGVLATGVDEVIGRLAGRRAADQARSTRTGASGLLAGALGAALVALAAVLAAIADRKSVV